MGVNRVELVEAWGSSGIDTVTASSPPRKGYGVATSSCASIWMV